MVSSFQDKLQVTIKTKSFEGPFSVLLDLIDSQKLSITEISLAQVTEQFLQYIASHEELPAQELADFLLVASRLLYIKSKAVLPVMIEQDEEEVTLEEQLRMYKKYKDATENIEALVTSNKTAVFGKIKGPQLSQGFYPPETLNMEDVYQALLKIIERIKPLIALPTVEVQHVVSINEKIEDIKRTITQKAKTSFKEILTSGSRQEAIVSFLAILELVKHRTIGVAQEKLFEDIYIQRV